VAEEPDRGQAAGAAGGISGRTLTALVVGQLGVHATMAGLRMAAPLQALREGYSAWAVGLLLALFAAAPVMLAMHAGRLADRHGYHRPVGIAVASSTAGALLAVASTFADGTPHFVLLCLAAMATGAGANMGMLAIQRTAGLAARNSTERVRIFSWLGIAPSFANVVGPVSAGFMIDAGGFRAAYLLLLLLPLLTLAGTRQVPKIKSAAADREAATGPAWHLLRLPGMRRLLFINWLLATAWDVHTFAVPIIGHERGFSASTIGLVLGTFTLSVSGVRLVIPLLAHRVEEMVVVRSAMLMTAVVLSLYPLAKVAWAMAALAVLLGIALGAVQPMIMSTLHHLTPDGRHGESLAFRSMAINLSSSVMPLAFGAAGVAMGAGALFWVVGAAVGAGSQATRGMAPVRT
jgi:MFS family permease